MGPQPLAIIAAKVLIILSLFVSLLSPALAADPAVGREKSFNHFVEQGVAANFSTRSLRDKIVSSRMFVLRLQDLLPSKGNPYYHMADFALSSTLPAYKLAQVPKNSDHPVMDDEKNPVWLPVANASKITQQEAGDKALVAPILKYFAQYVGTVEIMENQIQPILAKSIIITPLEETLGENKPMFDQAWEFTKFTASKYKEFLAQDNTKDLLVRQKKKAMLLVISSIAQGMINYVDSIANESNKLALREFIDGLNALGTLEPTDTNISAAKLKLKQLTAPNSINFKAVKKALDSVDLPDTGDIDGADEAFEIAMRLEVGFDILKSLINHINENW